MDDDLLMSPLKGTFTTSAWHLGPGWTEPVTFESLKKAAELLKAIPTPPDVESFITVSESMRDLIISSMGIPRKYSQPMLWGQTAMGLAQLTTGYDDQGRLIHVSENELREAGGHVWPPGTKMVRDGESGQWKVAEGQTPLFEAVVLRRLEVQLPWSDPNRHNGEVCEVQSYLENYGPGSTSRPRKGPKLRFAWQGEDGVERMLFLNGWRLLPSVADLAADPVACNLLRDWNVNPKAFAYVRALLADYLLEKGQAEAAAKLHNAADDPTKFLWDEYAVRHGPGTYRWTDVLIDAFGDFRPASRSVRAETVGYATVQEVTDLLERHGIEEAPWPED